MYSKPEIIEKLQAIHTAYQVEFCFKNNITIIMGESGSGKTTVFEILQEASLEDDRLLCINYLDKRKGRDIDELIQNATGKLIVIDNADILLTEGLRKYIAFDSKNQYIIIGRNPSNLMATRENLYELSVENKDGKTIFRLKNYI